MEVLLILAAAGLLAAGGALVAGLSRRSKEKALGEPRLVVSPAPYAFGEVVPCRLASVVRAPIRVERVRFFLRCAESVRWTETETDGNGRRRSVERTQAYSSSAARLTPEKVRTARCHHPGPASATNEITVTAPRLTASDTPSQITHRKAKRASSSAPNSE